MDNSVEAHEGMLDTLQRESFQYFLYEVNPANGLVIDKTEAGSPSSIAAVGLALAAYPVAVERGLLDRGDAIARTLAVLRFFRDSPQDAEPDATGYKGFYYHFLDMQTGRRVWECELSTMDSALLFAGMLTAAEYFTDESSPEHEIRKLAVDLFSRADWQWARNGGATVANGWRPECGFLEYRWEGFDEALILYLLGLGSPTYPLPEESYQAWASTYKWKKIYGYEYLHAGPLFIHQLAHVWVDFRGIQDAFMREKGIDYFENSRRATHVQREYATHNPCEFEGYGTSCWGLTASNGPGPATRTIRGRKREFFDYAARGVPNGPDDGTIAPWAAASSLPFAPEIVTPALEHFIHDVKLKESNKYGFKAAFNLTFPPTAQSPRGWVSKWHCGLNQGPIVLMVENYRSGFLWDLMRKCPYLLQGLRRAGFRNGWL
ncbi:MAG TPA: glucoamylase family protein [Bryobacteraceae bacterium]|nr:glucoamylase family protein [Bryobacteraceae bacterium]